MTMEESIIATHLRFNADYSCLLLGTRDNFKLLSLLQDDFPEEFNSEQGVHMVERHLLSRLLMFVPYAEPRNLILFNIQTRKRIHTLRYASNIVAVRTTNQRLVVAVEDRIHIHDVPKLDSLHELEDTPTNSQGILALCTDDERSFLAYPGSSIEGVVQVFDVNLLHTITTISAHRGLLSALAFNASGTLLATASVKGTVIRVFSTEANGVRLLELRRGLARLATIHSLTFSSDGAFLVSSSSTETVHVFRMDGASTVSDASFALGSEDSAGSGSCENSESGGGGGLARSGSSSSSLEQQEGWLQWMYSTLCASTNYLPSQVSDILRPNRATIVARLPPTSANMMKIAAIVRHNQLPRLVVVSADGVVHLFAIDTMNEGEAVHVKSVNLWTDDTAEEITAGDNQLNSGATSLAMAQQSTSIMEGLANLRILDDTEFPPLPNRPAKGHKKRR